MKIDSRVVTPAKAGVQWLGGEWQGHQHKQKPRRPTIFILLCGLYKPMVIPAKAGIQRGGRCGTHGTQTFPPTNPYEVSPPANPAKL